MKSIATFIEFERRRWDGGRARATLAQVWATDGRAPGSELAIPAILDCAVRP